jgi:hypothetical protein
MGMGSVHIIRNIYTKIRNGKKRTRQRIVEDEVVTRSTYTFLLRSRRHFSRRSTHSTCVAHRSVRKWLLEFVFQKFFSPSSRTMTTIGRTSSCTRGNSTATSGDHKNRIRSTVAYCVFAVDVIVPLDQVQ